MLVQLPLRYTLIHECCGTFKRCLQKPISEIAALLGLQELSLLQRWSTLDFLLSLMTSNELLFLDSQPCGVTKASKSDSLSLRLARVILASTQVCT